MRLNSDWCVSSISVGSVLYAGQHCDRVNQCVVCLLLMSSKSRILRYTDLRPMDRFQVASSFSKIQN